MRRSQLCPLLSYSRELHTRIHDGMSARCFCTPINSSFLTLHPRKRKLFQIMCDHKFRQKTFFRVFKYSKLSIILSTFVYTYIKIYHGYFSWVFAYIECSQFVMTRCLPNLKITKSTLLVEIATQSSIEYDAEKNPSVFLTASGKMCVNFATDKSFIMKYH